MPKNTLEPHDLVAACRRLYAGIDRLDTAAAATVGVSRNDLRCLNLLSENPQKPGKIATELGLTTGSVTALLDRLEKVGLAERRRDPDDRRGVIVHPTAQLFKALGPLYRGVAVELERIAGTYTESELRSAVRHLGDAASAYEAALK